MPFPDPEKTDPNGIVCAGGELNSEILLAAYSRGIFPWPQEGYPLLWFCPHQRGVIDFKDFHIPKSLKKQMAKSSWRMTFDHDFLAVIENCAKVPRDGETGTWILPEMQKAYIELHKQGVAHSVEAWEGDRLVGGLYGVFVQGLFSGESMFFHKSGASKICLVHLVEHLQKIGCQWMDIQMVTPVLEMFGGTYIPRKVFLQRLKTLQKRFGSAESSIRQF